MVRKSVLIKAVSSEIPLSRPSPPLPPRLLNKLYRVKSLFALPQIIRRAVSLAKVIPAGEISAVENDERSSPVYRYAAGP